MRRIRRKIAENQNDQIGDTTTVADSHVVEALVKGKQQENHIIYQRIARP